MIICAITNNIAHKQCTTVYILYDANLHRIQYISHFFHVRMEILFRYFNQFLTIHLTLARVSVIIFDIFTHLNYIWVIVVLGES